MTLAYDEGYTKALEKLGFDHEKVAFRGIIRGAKKVLGRRAPANGVPKQTYVESVRNSMAKRQGGAAPAAAKAAPEVPGAQAYTSPRSYAPKTTAQRSAEVFMKNPEAPAAATKKPSMVGRALKWGLPGAAVIGGAAAMRHTNQPQVQQPLYQEIPRPYYNELPQYY